MSLRALLVQPCRLLAAPRRPHGEDVAWAACSVEGPALRTCPGVCEKRAFWLGLLSSAKCYSCLINGGSYLRPSVFRVI